MEFYDFRDFLDCFKIIEIAREVRSFDGLWEYIAVA